MTIEYNPHNCDYLREISCIGFKIAMCRNCENSTSYSLGTIGNPDIQSCILRINGQQRKLLDSLCKPAMGLKQKKRLIPSIC